MVAKPLYPLYKYIIKPLDRAYYPELRYIIITCLLQVVLMDTTIILLPIMVAMVLLLELVQVVEVQEIVILAVEQVNIGKKLGNIQEIHIRRK